MKRYFFQFLSLLQKFYYNNTKKMTKIILRSIVLTGFVFMLAGCGLGQKTAENTAENMAENAIEKETGGNADVDIEKDKVDIKTEDGSMQAGEDVSLPADFPKDVYVFEGKIKTVIQSNETAGFSVSIETDKAVESIKSIYEEKLKADGWKITGSMVIGDSITVVGEKDNRTVSIMAGKGEKENTIVINVANKN